MTRIIRPIYILLLLLVSIGSYAQEFREIPDEAVDKLRQDSELDYPIDVGEEAGWFQAVYEFIVEAINRFYTLLNEGALSKEFLYLVSFIAAGVVAWLLLRSRYSWVFSSRGRETHIDYDIRREDIHAIDYEEEINKAIRAEDFRLAVRLVYLRTLKLLSDHQLIRWAEGKTNNQYTRELADSGLQTLFFRISYQFNYLWYGHFDANKGNWEETQRIYQDIEKSIKN